MKYRERRPHAETEIRAALSVPDPAERAVVALLY